MSEDLPRRSRIPDGSSASGVDCPRGGVLAPQPYACPVSTTTAPGDTLIQPSTAEAVRIGVLAVQGDVREHLAALTALGAEATTVRRPAEVELVDGLVIPGGESTVMDKLVRAFDLREPLLRRIAEGMPAYGSCAGMIMLADRLVDARPDQQTLGGLDVTVRRNA
ncbi:MAG: pyridoxal 5'-phosphate synthase glutaminase subunit PdxT, partial [Dermatophilaceae bacterium]|nr:pyridoxal 5'-phosphate synthase glutaminase subunit PdxT [Dermatophilaceae bacterium]